MTRATTRPGDGRETRFLPAGRTGEAALREEAARLAANPVVAAVLQAAGGALAILDAHRQIVAVNRAGLDLIGGGAAEALGLRPGEALGCTHAGDGPDGCGTGAACAGCGAALALIACERRGEAVERECAITVTRGGRRVDVDLHVRAAPFEVDGARLTLLSVADVSDERRREQLERTFFGDVRRRLAALREAVAGLGAASPPAEAVARVRAQLAHLDRLVEIQRALHAGLGEALAPAPRTIVIADELKQLAWVVERQGTAGRRLEIVQPPPAEVMVADPALLQHVLLAMVTNGLEAARADGAVRVDVELSPALATFRVWNPGAIPAAVTHRIFQRHFTTRGPGRGSGTWSMKAVGEELMHGEVGFRTSVAAGTTFWLTLPRRPFARA